MEKIEVFELVIDPDDNSGVTAIALVDEPAIESNWMAFSKKSDFSFSIKDEEKRIIEGYFMIADLLIPRLKKDGTKFFVKFKAKTIEAIREKQSKLGLMNNFNLMHDPEKKAEGVIMLDNLIIDNERGKIAPKEFEKVPNGSMWGSAKINNDEIWQQIKEGTFRGFSVEGNFKQLNSRAIAEKTIEKIKGEIKEFKKNTEQSPQLKNKKTIESMSLEVIEKLKNILFEKEPSSNDKFVSQELSDGTIAEIDPALEIGATVTINVNGEKAPLPDGDYPLSDGTTINVSGGVILSIEEASAQSDPQEQSADVAPKETPTEAKVRKIIESVETVFNVEIEKIKEDFSTVEKELKEIKEEFSKYKDTTEENKKAMFSAIQVLSKEPSVEPVVKKKSGFMASKKKNNSIK